MSIGSFLLPNGNNIGDHLVRFFDIDGTILKEQYVNTGNDATAPAIPNYDPTYLVFAEWNQSFTNIQQDLDIGAIYDTIDGKTYIFVRITNTTGLQPTFDLNKTTADLLTIDWGDSTTSTTSTNGNVTVQKGASYSTIGDYIITMDCAGGYRNRDNNTLFTTAPYRQMVLKVYMGSNMTIARAIFSSFTSMRIISIQKSTFNDTSDAFNGCLSLIHCNIPKNATGFGIRCFNNCISIKSLSFPTSVNLISESTFQGFGVTGVKINLNNITDLSFNAFAIFAFSAIRGNFNFPTNQTAVLTSTFLNCGIDSVSFGGSTLTTLQSSCFLGARAINDLEFPASLTTIASNSFNETALVSITFLSTTPPTISAGTFNSLAAASKIYVPDANVATYKAATNWSAYANYIYPLSTKP